MEFILICMAWVLFLYGIYKLVTLGYKPCPREEAGYACRREKGQKCECER